MNKSVIYEKVIEYAKANKIKFAVVKNDEIDPAMDLNGYNFLDMNQHLDEIGFDEATDYKDGGTHTNIVGADKVTVWFEDYLSENYVQTGKLGKHDRRHGRSYNSWKKSYDLWMEELSRSEDKIRERIANGELWKPEGNDDAEE